MRPGSKLGFVALLLCGTLTIAAAAARNVASATNAANAGGLLSAEQGAMLVDYALQAGARLTRQPDCSHLVHLIYSHAGLNYSYQPSRALYVGVDDFERVSRPQAGDLIVWRGHVGIVVSPREKTFFSSVRSGIITESWTAHQWIRRGRPRFLRYRIGPESDLELLASVARSGEDGISGTTDGQTDTSGDDAASTVVQQEDDDEPQDTAPADSVSSAGIVAVIKQRGKPSRKEIASAVLESSKNTAEALLGSTASIRADRPISVFARLEVQNIKIRHESGTVVVKFTETMAIDQGKVLPGKTTERVFSISKSTDGGSASWLITDPHMRALIPQAQAVNVFAHQAELMLHDSPNSPAARTMIKALDLLYDQQSNDPQRAALKRPE
ncbi:MAG TPA: NlpC/P60 family protein [Verrucomicrobiae bacterium]|nr:NlpC/P60 family protein [Verrucomicrobiae bacterium]